MKGEEALGLPLPAGKILLRALMVASVDWWSFTLVTHAGWWWWTFEVNRLISSRRPTTQQEAHFKNSAGGACKSRSGVAANITHKAGNYIGTIPAFCCGAVPRLIRPYAKLAGYIHRWYIVQVHVLHSANGVGTPWYLLLVFETKNYYELRTHLAAVTTCLAE